MAEARVSPEGQKAAPAGRTPARREAPRRGDAMALQRRAPGEAAEKLQKRGGRAVLAALARKLARWAADEGDICVPLPSIADAASEAWRRRARMALLEVFGRRTAAEADAQIRTLLLADIRAVFRATSATRMVSQEICARLAEMEDRPWPEFRRGGPISPPQLAAALLPSRSAPARTRCAPRRVGRRRTVRREVGAAEGAPCRRVRGGLGQGPRVRGVKDWARRRGPRGTAPSGSSSRPTPERQTRCDTPSGRMDGAGGARPRRAHAAARARRLAGQGRRGHQPSIGVHGRQGGHDGR